MKITVTTKNDLEGTRPRDDVNHDAEIAVACANGAVFIHATARTNRGTGERGGGIKDYTKDIQLQFSAQEIELLLNAALSSKIVRTEFRAFREGDSE